MEGITISYIDSSSAKYKQVWELREEILRRPIGLSLINEDLTKDHTDTIFIAEHDNVVVACLMLQHKAEKLLQLRQMAVKKECQGRGIGRLLVVAAEKFAAMEGYEQIMLHARKTVIGFYESLQYSAKGAEFTEVGIPHFLMEKVL